MTSDIMRVDTAHPSPDTLDVASKTLADGGLVVFPTETVYGLGLAASASSTPAALFEVKRRPAALNIPWLVDAREGLSRYACDAPRFAHELASAFWPGSLTIVVKASTQVPLPYRAEDGSIALRASSSAIVNALIDAISSPLAATSANLHGQPAPICFEQVDEAIITAAEICLDGGSTGMGEPSTIVSCVSGRPVLIREGACPLSSIEDVIGGLS